MLGKKKKKTLLNTGRRCFWSFKSSSGTPSGKIRVCNIIFMNVQCSDSCSSFGVPAICCYFITRRTSTVFRKLTLDSSNAPTIWKEKKRPLFKVENNSLSNQLLLADQHVINFLCSMTPFIYTYHQIISGKDLTSTITRGLRF